MKRCFVPPFFFILIYLTGCETSELTLNQDADRLATKLGVESSEIQYLGVGNFVVKKLGAFGRYYPKGMVVLTQDEIRVYSRYQNLIMSKSYEELEGVSMIESQVHVKDDVHKIVLELGVNPLRYDHSIEREQVYSLLLGFSVPNFELTRASNIDRSRFRSEFYSDSYFVNDD